MITTKILVIDDCQADTDVLRIMIADEAKAFSVESINDGRDAMAYVHNFRHPEDRPVSPQVIVLDMHLEPIDGIAVLQAIRLTPALSAVPVVVVSGSANPADKSAVVALDAQYRTKPMALNGVAELAREIIDLCQNQFAANA